MKTNIEGKINDVLMGSYLIDFESLTWSVCLKEGLISKPNPNESI